MKRLGLQMLAILLAGAALGGVVCFLRPPTTEWLPAPRIVAEDLTSAAAQRYLWIDARSAEEFDAGHVPGALPLRVSEWDDLLPAVVAAWTPGAPIVVYCGMSRCQLSEEVAAKLRADTGWTGIHVLQGDWRSVRKEERR